MFPTPPHLFKGHGVTDDPPGETYWKVANGIWLSAMPSYKKSLTEEQMWQVSLLLATPINCRQRLSPQSRASKNLGNGEALPKILVRVHEFALHWKLPGKPIPQIRVC